MTEIAGARHVSRRGGPRHPGHPLARAAAVLHSEQVTSTPRTLGRLALGGALAFAGTSHLTVAREEFQAQVPPWFPADPDAVVIVSGWVEIGLGLALLVAPRRHRWRVGLVVAAFFVAIFPGNISQFVTGTDGFGLDSDVARGVRLLFQPVLVLWALWSTDAVRAWRASRESRRR